MIYKLTRIKREGDEGEGIVDYACERERVRWV